MQKLLSNMHIYMHSKVQKYAKKYLYCVLKNQTFKILKYIVLSKKKYNLSTYIFFKCFEPVLYLTSTYSFRCVLKFLNVV